MKHTESVIQSDPLVGHDARTVPEMDGACRSHRPPMGRAIPLLLPRAAKLTAGTSAARDQAKVRLLSAAVTELANA